MPLDEDNLKNNIICFNETSKTGEETLFKSYDSCLSPQLKQKIQMLSKGEGKAKELWIKSTPNHLATCTAVCND